MKIIMKTRSLNVLFFSKIMLQIIVFLYIYNILFAGFPNGFGTRQIFGFCGVFKFLIEVYKKIYFRHNLNVNKNLIKLLLIILLLGIVSLFTNLLNNTDERVFLRYPLSFVSVIFSAYFVISFLKNIYEEISIIKISEYFVRAVFIQVIIACSMFFIPSLKEILLSIQSSAEFDENIVERVAELRIIGFGSMFFGSGVINGYALILIPFLIRTSKMNNRGLFFYTFNFLLIFVVGMMMARTTMIGSILGFVLFFSPLSIKRISFSKKIPRFFFFLFSVPSAIIIYISFLSNEIKDKISNLANFGFELFINYVDGNGLTSSSSEDLKSMYIWPSELKTYLIGDGYFIDPDNPSFYYMGSDVGYIRLIYYFGIIGMIIYLLVCLYPLIVAYKIYQNKLFKILFVLSGFYLIVLNLKGFTDVFFIFILIGLALQKGQERNFN